ncbi:MAG TPA: agmatine deiminase family protein [Flavobacteriales bacterium]|nr:agmatine deiminase family protein [Flavobacteriales bacterium]
MTRSTALVLLTSLAFSLLIQQRAIAQDLPHQLAPHEAPLIPAYRDGLAGSARGITTPPDFVPRTMAEWEEVQTLVITWTSFPSILKQIVRYAKDECEVLIVCSDQNSVISTLQNSSAGGPITDLDNITFLEAPFNSIWVRDYGPETIYQNEVDSLFLLDWIYNRPRPLDNALSDVIATTKNIGIYSTTSAPWDLVHTGGNFMSDGFGTAFSSNLVLEENGPNGDYNSTIRDAGGVDNVMTQFMGIQPGRYVKMTPLPYDNINHIDMHMKLLDEETLLVGQFPTGVSDGPQIEQNIQYVLSNFNSVFGTPYRIVRVPMPPSTGGAFPPTGSYRTYANNIFINKTVIVPTYREQYDTTGLRILRENLPGYRVVGIDCDDSGNNIISQSGAIHCITKTIGVSDPLLIRHQRLTDTYETVAPYNVEAYIRHKTGIESAEVYWTTDTTAGYAPVSMSPGPNNTWNAAIPAHPAGTLIYYYIHAAANSGKEQVRPITAPHGWWRFRVLDLNAGIEAQGPVVMEVFPNPTSDVLAINVGNTGSQRVRITLRDALGREAMLIHDAPMHADGRAFADLRYLGPGAYHLVVESSTGRRSVKVVKR